MRSRTRPRNNALQAAETITSIWEPQQGEFFFICTRRSDGEWRERPLPRDEWGDLPDLVHQHQDKDLYFCPHSFSRPHRRKAFAEPSPFFWEDLDRTDPRVLAVEPTVAWSTSPRRFAALWALDEAPDDATRRAFNKLVGADGGGWCITKLLRVPGSLNFKYDPPARGRLLWCNGPAHRLRDIRALLPAPRRASSVPRHGPRRPMPGHIEQLLARQPWKHGRSATLFFAVYRPLMRAGWSDAEIARVVERTEWNKFRGRDSYTLLDDISNSRARLLARGDLP